MPDKKFELGDYVEVKDRIKLFYELFGQGRLVTGEVRLSTEPDGVPRVMVQGLAYRSPDDPLPGVGWSWMALPGSTPYTRGSELENVETSAWGRAIGSLGILIDRSIASAQEVENKRDERPAPPRLPARQDPATVEPAASEAYTEHEEMLGRVRRNGMIRKGTSDRYKLAAHIGPEGHAIGFRLEVGPEKHIPQCIVDGPLGEALYVATGEHPDKLIGVAATVSGLLYSVKGPKSSWYRLHVDHIETTIDGLEVVLPADIEAPAEALLEPPEDVPLVGESVPMGLAS